MRRVFVAILLTELAVSGFAQEPALGRLFLTPEQRAALDNARRNKIRVEAMVSAAEKKPRIPPAKSVTINGVVSRSDGESTIWVNGRPTEGQTQDGMRVAIAPGSQSSVVLREPAKGKQVRLKVGQHADLISGRIDEPYERRRTAAPPPSSTAPAAGEQSSALKDTEQRGAKSLRSRRQQGEQDDRAAPDEERDAAPSPEEKAATQ
ncbi:MAG TPA: hypothetical protein VMH26_19980 [Burkholderiales bacterium]|nr:hypothetical protein [Burkholderiales bacterium]